ncbi:MAG TPA: TSUP family transporter [Rhodocyclaceae bacterium]|nr:TSUP family transporter [Rhodocyclaceae bacterium]
MEAADLLLLLPAAFFAGLVDAVVGGGGLIQIPALFSALPELAPATIFGTNKLASICGTFSATLRYVRRVEVPWRLALLAALTAFMFSFAGAMCVALLPKAWARPLVLVLLIAVAIYTFVRKDFGQDDQGLAHGRRHLLGALLLGAGIGFYDGFFGPGTGSFLLFLFVRFFGLDFLRATSAAKIVNLSTNAAALLYFGPTGHVLWLLAGGMALCNVAGAQLGSVLALKHGSGFVRKLFLLVVTVLIVKFAWDTFL